jgi:hypothetical protein
MASKPGFFQGRRMIRATLDLPISPSVNQLWRSWDSADAALRLARKGYADAGAVAPRDYLNNDEISTQSANEMRGTPEQMPDISGMGLFSGNRHSFPELLHEVYRNAIDDPSLPTALTGIPGMVWKRRHAAFDVGDYGLACHCNADISRRARGEQESG